jgi:hypothetical protein
MVEQSTGRANLAAIEPPRTISPKTGVDQVTSDLTEKAVSPAWLAIALAFTLGVAAIPGCSSKPPLTPEQQVQADVATYDAEIRKVVSDPARAQQLIRLSQEYQQQIRENVVLVRAYRAKLAALNANYQATRADFEALFSQHETNREAMLGKAAAIRERMAAVTTDAEWQDLNKINQRIWEIELLDAVS